MLLSPMAISSNNLVTSVSPSSWDENKLIVINAPKVRLSFFRVLVPGQIPTMNGLAE